MRCFKTSLPIGKPIRVDDFQIVVTSVTSKYTNVEITRIEGRDVYYDGSVKDALCMLSGPQRSRIAG